MAAAVRSRKNMKRIFPLSSFYFCYKNEEKQENKPHKEIHKEIKNHRCGTVSDRTMMQVQSYF